MARILVCGGREYDNVSRLYSVLDATYERLNGDMVIVTGAQRKWIKSERRFVGADYHAEEWAKSREVEYMGFPAKWKQLAKKAGYERNIRMYRATLPNGCIAFPGGAGTRMMCGIMVEYGILPWCIDWKFEAKPVTLARAPETISGGTSTQIADAIEACDWSGCSIGNKEILKAAVRQLRALATEGKNNE